MRRLIIVAAFMLLSVTLVASVVAQTACPDFVAQALQQLSSNCGDLPRNSACYGYNHVIATFFTPLSPDAFSHPNDRVDLASMQSITTSPLDVQTAQWGIAIIKAQANLPDALPGQAVTFMLLCDVHLTHGVTQGSDMTPMQAIYFTTGIADTKCSNAPQSSLVIQGPKNITVDMRVNGADIKLGSTAIFRSTPNSTMSCGVIDGAAHVGDSGQVIPAGFAARVPLDAQLNANGDWGGDQPIADQDASELQVLKDIPSDVLDYTPDVPTPEEVDLLGSLNADFISTFDPHELRALVRLMIAEGDTPDMVAEWDPTTLQNFIADHADELAQAAADEAAPDQAATDQAAPDQAATDQAAPDQAAT